VIATKRADVVFVSHEATLTGAPVGLLQFLRWLRANTDLDVEVVLLEGGPIADAFEGVAAVRTLDDLTRSPAPQVLFLNSCFSAAALAESDFEGSYVIARIPELELAFDEVLRPEVRAALLSRADRFIAVADRVRRHLVDTHGVADEDVAIVHGSVPVDDVRAGLADIERARSAIGIPPGVPVVGGVGKRSWRKGADWFVQLAVDVVARCPFPVHFVWLGSHDESAHFRRLDDDVARAGLASRVHLLDDVPDPAGYQALMDVFVLTSREDPFPRVALEAAALGRPIAAFDSGGVEELLAHAHSGVVPYGDVEAMGERIVGWLEEPASARAMGDLLADAVCAKYDLKVGAPKLLAEIERGLS